MKITEIEPVPLRLMTVDESRCDGTQDAFLIQIHTDQGVVGIGEADAPPLPARAIIEMPSSHAIAMGVRDLLLGRDPLDVGPIWHELYHRTRYYGQSGLAVHVLAGIDVALHDLVGKIVGQPVCRLIGGQYRDRVKVYASELMPATTDETERLVGSLREQGYRAIKLGWGPLGQSVETDVELVRAARRACGSDCELMVDAGQPWTWRRALDMARRFQEFDLTWLEEPLRPDDLDGYARLTERSPVTIAAGEQDATVGAFEELAIRGGVDVLQPDVGRCGFTQARVIATMAERLNRRCVPHAFSTGVLVAASLQFAASMPRGTLAEFTVTESPLARELLARPFQLDADGCVGVPEGPGLGVELDWEAVERYRLP